MVGVDVKHVGKVFKVAKKPNNAITRIHARPINPLGKVTVIFEIWVVNSFARINRVEAVIEALSV
jgi:hypothetical protein